MKTIEYLRKYNEWRRGADTEQPDPTELGEQIDAAIGAMVMIEEMANLAETLKKERDEARNLVQSGIRARASLNEALDKTLHDLREAREKNAKLRDIAEWAIELLINPPALSIFPTLALHNKEHGQHLRAELDQLKEGAK